MLSPEKPVIALTGRYTTGQAAKRLGCHRNTILTASESLLPRHHFENGNNCYLGKDLLKFWAKKTNYID
ncbi:MAG: hypothetical protein J6W09_07305 [Bacteroidales bacterium]|nr:hypothetical protein [Bacteroidales bacterium]